MQIIIIIFTHKIEYKQKFFYESNFRLYFQLKYEIYIKINQILKNYAKF